MVPGGRFGPDRLSQRSGRRDAVSGAGFGLLGPGGGVAAPPEQRGGHIQGDHGEEEGGKEHDRVQIHGGARVRSVSARGESRGRVTRRARAQRTGAPQRGGMASRRGQKVLRVPQTL